MASYDEYGVVGRLFATADGATGHIDIKAGATVYQVEQLGGTATKVSIDPKATVYDIDQKKVEGAVINETERFTETITATHGTDDRITANECLHDGDTEIVIDGQHAYEVCKKCGFTLISIVKNDTNEVQRTVASASGDIAIIPMASYAENQIAVGSSISESDGVVKLIEDINTETGYVAPAIEDTPVISEKIDLSCDHAWNTVVTNSTCSEAGSSVTSCNKCGANYSSVISKLNHSFTSGIYADNQDGATHSQKCIRCNEFGAPESHTLVDCKCTKCGFTHVHNLTETSSDFIDEGTGYYLYTYSCSYGDTLTDTDIASLKGAVCKVVKNGVTYYGKDLSAGSKTAGKFGLTVTLISDSSGDKTYTQANHKGTWVIDLNGYSLTNARGVNTKGELVGTSMAPGLIAAQAALEYGGTHTLTIKDTSINQTGLIYNNGNAPYSVAVYIASNCAYNIKIESGTIKSDSYALFAANGTITVNGGIIDGELGTDSNGKIVINAGKFTSINASKYLSTGKILVEEDGYFVVKDSSQAPTTYTARVNSLYFTTVGGGNKALNFAKELGTAEVELKEAATVVLSLVENESITIIGDSSLYIAPIAATGFELSTESVTGRTRYYVPEIKPFTVYRGTTKFGDYDTLEEAKNTANKTSFTIKLNKDYTYTPSSGSYFSYSYQSSSTQDLTIDLQGHTLTISSGKMMKFENKKGIVTIQNGTIIGETASGVTLITSSNAQNGYTKGFKLINLTIINNGKGWVVNDTQSTTLCTTKLIQNCTLTGAKVNIANYSVVGNTKITMSSTSGTDLSTSIIKDETNYTYTMGSNNYSIIVTPKN